MPHSMPQLIITHDEAEFQILRSANEKGCMGLPIGLAEDQQLQDGFARCLEKDYMTLIDVLPMKHAPGLMRVYKLTEAGKLRLGALNVIFAH